MTDKTEPSAGVDGGSQSERVRDILAAPTVFVDGIHGMQLRDGVAMLNFSQHVYPAPNSGNGDAFADIVLRLAVPLPAFAAMADWFISTKKSLIENNILVMVTEDANDDSTASR